jgi:Cu-Zn family superoxide dismutase
MMKNALRAYAGFCVLMTMACGGPGSQDAAATADLLDRDGKKIGSAVFSEMGDGVRIQVQLSKLAPGIHAMHIHNVGECHGPDFKSSGPHFNPFGKKHGSKNPEGPHAGDLPNVEVKADGTVAVEVTAKLVTLKQGKNSLFQPGGTCLMIHEKADDEATDPAGNAGERLACGVIKKK